MSVPHVTVIGAGIIGMATAGFLKRRGLAVTVIDPLPPGEGCSFGNAGGIAFSEVMPTVHARMLLKIPGWLLDPLGPLTIRWSYLPKALPWFLAAARQALPARVLCARNMEYCEPGTEVHPGDEVAFFPPVTGG